MLMVLILPSKGIAWQVGLGNNTQPFVCIRNVSLWQRQTFTWMKGWEKMFEAMDPESRQE
jgi:hypothetical protein